MTGEVYLPGQGCIYVAPTGIVHYISAHWYKPPTPFLEAVLACPPMGSMTYKKAILQNAGRSLLRAKPNAGAAPIPRRARHEHP
jgi:hypothetical protein